MSGREALLEAMRRDLRTVARPLLEEGWTQAEVTEISELVKAHLAAEDDAALQALALWLASRAASICERARAEWEACRAGEFAVRHDEAELREINRAWMQARMKGKERTGDT